MSDKTNTCAGGNSQSGWWDYEPDQLWRLPPGDVCPLTRRESQMLGDGFYPATSWLSKKPPTGFPSDDPWITRGLQDTGTTRSEHYGGSDE